MGGWPVYELCHAAEHVLYVSALAAYRHDVLIWAQIAGRSRKQVKPPTLPDILK